MAGQFLPADHSRGDANTIGGYAAVHDRPAAFEGTDGFSYSVELMADDTGDAKGGGRWGAYLLFIRWARLGAQSPEGHLESDYVVRAESERDARDQLGRLSLTLVKEILDQLIADKAPAAARRWWDVMKSEDAE